MEKSKIICVVNDIALPESELLSEHGLSIWVETPQGVMLWDSGGSAAVLQHNLKTLGLDAGRIRALALSHGHNDHTGGLGFLLQANPDLPIYAHPDILRPRFSRKNGAYLSMGLPEQSKALKGHRSLFLHDQPTEIMPGLWTSGEIRERAELEGRSANHFIKVDGAWETDPYLDDMSLVLETAGGILLICGCCHAGLLNTLRQVQRQFTQPVRAVVGGTHLISADGAALQHVIDVLDGEYPQMRYYLNHCSGKDAVCQLQDTFGERVEEFPAGSILEIDD